MNKLMVNLKIFNKIKAKNNKKKIIILPKQTLVLKLKKEIANLKEI
jgi:hypothetical protein